MAYAPDGSILVVDDNEQIVQALSELLQIEGFTVFTAQNGLVALNKMRAPHRISLVRRADLYDKLRQLTAAERERPRYADCASIHSVPRQGDPCEHI